MFRAIFTIVTLVLLVEQIKLISFCLNQPSDFSVAVGLVLIPCAVAVTAFLVTRIWR